MTGAEPAYDPELWNSRMEYRETHNCFSYAMNAYDPKQIARCRGKEECNAPFHQPGSASGHGGFEDKRPKTCPNLFVRTRGDNPSIQPTTFTKQCPAGFSKIALIIDESDDYHYLRQDSNGYWSHKPGARSVTNVDAAGHPIWDPKLAHYNYTKDGTSTLNYDVWCSYMCVPRNRPLFLRVAGGGTRRQRPTPLHGSGHAGRARLSRTRRSRQGSQDRRN